MPVPPAPASTSAPACAAAFSCSMTGPCPTKSSYTVTRTMLLQRRAGSVPDRGERAGLVFGARRDRVGQDGAHPVVDLAGDLRLRLGAVDHEVAVRLGVSEGAEPAAYA